MNAFNSAPEPLPTAFLGNLHPSTVQGDFDDPNSGLFRELKVQDIRIVRDKESDRPKGYGYAVFKDEDSLRKALDLTGAEVCGNRVRIDVKRPKGQKGNDRSDGAGRGGFPSSRGNDFGGAFGSRARRDQTQYTAFVSNLPEEATEQDLEEMFRVLDLKSVKLPLDRDTGKHRGYGYADFGTRESLEEALTLNGADWMGHELKVQVHEPRHKPYGAGSSRLSGGRAPRAPYEENDAALDDPERPKLVLQKKTGAGPSPSTSAERPASSRKSNPFGNAKPVDTAAKLRELEEKAKAKEQAAEQSSEQS